MTRTQATITGFSAVLLWSLLALFTVGTTPVPPLQLNAMCFGIGALIGILWIIKSREFHQLTKVSWKVYAFGTIGLFGYHFLYFSALRMAPPAQAGLIAYLWPLLIVLLSGLLPGEKLRRGHLIGAFFGFAGAALVILGDLSAFRLEYLLGYVLAFGCALTWSVYSVFSRQLADIPTATVAVFCLLTSLLSLAAHLTWETTAWPSNTDGWLSVAALGIGPVGLAFFVWDLGVKRGNIQLLGVSAYAAPLLSTLVLVTFGIAQPHWSLILSAALVSGGALFAARSDQT